jgi:negative regulator of sigma-B (phosphoserine phosphatase)
LLPSAVHHISVPRDGEFDSGDKVVVVRGEGATLIAVVDALGHGVRAAHVAEEAGVILAACDPNRGVEAIIGDVHKALRGGRGACLLACVVRKTSIEGASIGNVEMRSSGVDLPFVLTPGVVGLRIPRLRIFRGTPRERVRIVMWSDGVSSRFQLSEYADFSPENACRAIFDRGRRPHDDATVLVADFGS